MAIAAQAVDRLLLPLLSAPTSALMTEALRSVIAAEAANLLVALQMSDVAAGFLIDAAEALICADGNCCQPAAADNMPQAVPAEDAVAADEVAACAAAARAAAAAGCWSAARQQSNDVRQQSLAACPRLSSLRDISPPLMPPHAALLLLCQLSEAAAAAAGPPEAQQPTGPTDDERKPALMLALLTAVKCEDAIVRLLSASEPHPSR